MITEKPSSRRGFLIATGAGAAMVSAAAQALVVESAACQVTLSVSDNACLRDLALSDFLPLMGQQLSAYAPGHAALLTLVEANALPARGASRPAQARTEPFSLVFRADRGAALEEGIHEFDHAQWGRFKLSLNEIRWGSSPAQKHYEVVFG